MILKPIGGVLTYFEEDNRCSYSAKHIGVDMFHVHTAALAVARHSNERAGSKVKKVRVLKQHFMVVDV